MTLIAPRVSNTQGADIGLTVDLLDADGTQIGCAWFAQPYVLLRGVAVDQYTPVTKPRKTVEMR